MVVFADLKDVDGTSPNGCLTSVFPISKCSTRVTSTMAKRHFCDIWGEMDPGDSWWHAENIILAEESVVKLAALRGCRCSDALC